MIAAEIARTAIEEPLGGIPGVCRGCVAMGKCSPESVKVCENNAARDRLRRAARKLVETHEAP